MGRVRPIQRGLEALSQTSRVHLDLGAKSTLALGAWTQKRNPMNLDTLLPLLDRLPSDPHTYLDLPAALAPHLSTVKRATRRPQPWTEYRLLAALALSGWSFRYGLGTDPNSGQTKRAFRQLTSAGLWEEQRVRITVNAVLVRLTPWVDLCLLRSA